MTILYDITRKVSPDLAVWPGDAPFSFEQILTREKGASVNLTTLTMSPHTGTHADATWHFDDSGVHPAGLPLEKFIGPAHVVTVKRDHGGITPEDLKGCNLTGAQRVLLHT